MEAHWRLLEVKPGDKRSNVERAADLIGEQIARPLNRALAVLEAASPNGNGG
jgi:hypothetical protein